MRDPRLGLRRPRLISVQAIASRAQSVDKIVDGTASDELRRLLAMTIAVTRFRRTLD